MLKKNKALSFVHPVGTMKRCLDCVHDGINTRHEIVEATGLREGQVRSALYNLTYIGAITKQDDAQKRTVYRVPGSFVSVTTSCWDRVGSVFAPRV